MGEMDVFNVEAPTKCPKCGKDIMIIPGPEVKHICPGCGDLYYDEHLGVWRIKWKDA